MERLSSVIFASVGSQLPFPRMMQVVDQWAARNAATRVLAQVGDDEGEYVHCEVCKSMTAKQYAEAVRSAKVVVSHAGMGTVLTALQCGTPIIVTPRRGSLHEARGEHQLATAKWLEKTGSVSVATDEEHLGVLMDNLEDTVLGVRISSHASPQLIGAIRQFIRQSQD
jgi:UDP-N-acetylglucosamine transferase subunit ALG13